MDNNAINESSTSRLFWVSFDSGLTPVSLVHLGYKLGVARSSLQDDPTALTEHEG